MNVNKLVGKSKFTVVFYQRILEFELPLDILVGNEFVGKICQWEPLVNYNLYY